MCIFVWVVQNFDTTTHHRNSSLDLKKLVTLKTRVSHVNSYIFNDSEHFTTRRKY
jgi:hypothetical protein